MEEMVVRATVKPTDCELTSQKLTSLPQVLDLGRKATRAAQIVQRTLATVAVARRELGTFKITAPPIKRETT